MSSRSRYVESEATTCRTFLAGTSIILDCCGPFRSFVERPIFLWARASAQLDSALRRRRLYSTPSIGSSPLCREAWRKAMRSRAHTKVLHRKLLRCMLCLANRLLQLHGKRREERRCWYWGSERGECPFLYNVWFISLRASASKAARANSPWNLKAYRTSD